MLVSARVIVSPPGAFPTGFRLALQRNCGIIAAWGTDAEDSSTTGRLAAGAAAAWLPDAAGARPIRRGASPRSIVCADQLVVALADPDQIVALSPYARDPAISVVAEQARALSAARLARRGHGPLKPDLVLVGPWDRAADAAACCTSLGIPRRRRRARQRPRDRRARRSARSRAARPSGARRGADRGDRGGARAGSPPRRGRGASTALLVGNGGYTVGPESLAGALLREAGLRRRPARPRATAATCRSRSCIMLRPDFLVLTSIVETPDGPGRALSHASGAARALSAREADRAAEPLHAVRRAEPGRGVRLSRGRADASWRRRSSYALRRPFRNDRGERVEPVGERGRAGLQDQRRFDLAQPAVAHRRDRIEARRARRPSPARISCRTRSRR